jgi:hypothetical protein
MLSVEQIRQKLNAPFEESRPERPARCHSRSEAEAARRLAYRLLRPLARKRGSTPASDAPAPNEDAND